MLPQKDVEFPAIDGIILRGRLYPAPEKGPGIVLCPGVSLSSYTSSMYLTAGT